jgi:hypothetical protein
MLENLPHAEPDGARADRVRVRCHAVLEDVQRRRVRRSRRPRAAETLLAFLGAAYLIETAHQALVLLGLV